MGFHGGLFLQRSCQHWANGLLDYQKNRHNLEKESFASQGLEVVHVQNEESSVFGVSNGQ